MNFGLKTMLAGASLLAIACAQPASATVVTFDDLTGSGLVATGYAGINWNQQFSYYDAPQSPYNPASGAERIYNLDQFGVRNPASSFNFASPVVFSGAYFSGYSATTVTFEMWLSGVLVATSGSLAPTDVPTFLSSGYGGLVDAVTVVDTGALWVMDNVTYNGVPEPATWALMIGGFGLAGVALRRRRLVVA